jgi:dimeric dUTPase (all-alpha-NTP-PPase superfamily)
MDKLEEMFAMQRSLNARILGSQADQLMQSNKTEWLLKYSRALQQEVSELIDCVPWKWWAHYQKEDVEHAKVELIDIIHFVISLAQTLGMTAEEVYSTYMKKNAVNFQRQDAGYTEKAHEPSLND